MHATNAGASSLLLLAALGLIAILAFAVFSGRLVATELRTPSRSLLRVGEISFMTVGVLAMSAMAVVMLAVH